MFDIFTLVGFQFVGHTCYFYWPGSLKKAIESVRNVITLGKYSFSNKAKRGAAKPKKKRKASGIKVLSEEKLCASNSSSSHVEFISEVHKLGSLSFF